MCIGASVVEEVQDVVPMIDQRSSTRWPFSFALIALII